MAKINQLRIIGGKWRGRKIAFSSSPGLRPTHDRVRETLFNWLAPYIEGANCLDLFSGSGALGFEALSRGANRVTFVDSAKEVTATLQQNVQLLGVKNAEIMLGDCSLPLTLSSTPFDIVFLDPPFGQGLIAQASQWLESGHALTRDAFIYIEAEKDLHPLPIPENWKVLKEKTTSSLAYYLLRRF